MIYSLSLENALVLTGILLLAGHLAAAFAEVPVKRWLLAFPRSGNIGSVLYTAAALWFIWLVASTDLGEFSPMRSNFIFVSVLGYILGLIFMREFLSVRSLGLLLLLAAEPLLESAWMRPELGRLCLVSLVYLWIVGGLFCVGMPYVLRDGIQWITGSPARWKAAVWSGVGYGLLLLGVRGVL
ncbi:MAG: hypothetical protein RLZZ399_1619 [Verrucomicrobiota bacterium]|jgi:hypothetical protein